jgi:hypothetical protein
MLDIINMQKVLQYVDCIWCPLLSLPPPGSKLCPSFPYCLSNWVESGERNCSLSYKRVRLNEKRYGTVSIALPPVMLGCMTLET